MLQWWNRCWISLTTRVGGCWDLSCFIGDLVLIGFRIEGLLAGTDPWRIGKRILMIVHLSLLHCTDDGPHQWIRLPGDLFGSCFGRVGVSLGLGWFVGGFCTTHTIRMLEVLGGGLLRDFCPSCSEPGELIKHLFIVSWYVGCRWEIVNVIMRHTPLLSLVQPCLLKTLQKAFNRQKWCPQQIILLTIFLHITWVEQDQMARQGNNFRLPLEHVIMSAQLQVEALKIDTTSPRKLRILQRSTKNLGTILKNYNEHNDNQWGLWGSTQKGVLNGRKGRGW